VSLANSLQDHRFRFSIISTKRVKR
jgi:hypothetical protein